MRPRIGFVIEQALGHVAYGASLRRVLAARTDMETEWLEIPYPEGAFGKIPGIGKNWTLRGSFRARRAIAEAHRKRPFDVLFIHTQTISVLAGDYMARIPTMLSLDATPINYDQIAAHYRDKVHSAPIETAKKLAHRAVMSQAKGFTVWSDWAKASLVNDYRVQASAITVIPPGSNHANFPDPRTRGPRREGPLRILFVGGDFVRKGGDLLLDTYRRQLAHKCELHLVTSESAGVTSGDGVHVYTGVKPHSELLLKLYADADVFVLPTRADCLAVVLGEAMASCLPIITTRVGAHAEAVEDGASGFLIDVDDGRALQERIERLIEDPALCATMGRRSRKIGEARFDIQKNANLIGDLLLDLHRGVRPRTAGLASADARVMDHA